MHRTRSPPAGLDERWVATSRADHSAARGPTRRFASLGYPTTARTPFFRLPNKTKTAGADTLTVFWEMNSMVAHPANFDSTARSAPPRGLKAAISSLKAPPVEPLRGAQARVAAAVQGHVWSGLIETIDIIDRATTLELIDARGDREMAIHLKALLNLAQGAKQRGEYATHRALMDEIARVRLLIELDQHEDDHWKAMGDGAIDVNGSLHGANGGISVLLGQAEAVCDLDGPHPLAGCGTGRRA